MTQVAALPKPVDGIKRPDPPSAEELEFGANNNHDSEMQVSKPVEVELNKPEVTYKTYSLKKQKKKPDPPKKKKPEGANKQKPIPYAYPKGKSEDNSPTDIAMIPPVTDSSSSERPNRGLELLASLALPLNDKQQPVPYATPIAQTEIVVGGIDISTTSMIPLNRTADPDECKEKIWVDNVRDIDVLCGRGGKSNHHPGNKRYREVVCEMKRTYRSTGGRKAKTDLSRAIVEHVVAYGARFVKRDESDGRYFLLTKAQARRKTSQALRETKELKWL